MKIHQLRIGRTKVPALPWIAAALGLNVVAVIVTMAVNVPLNNAIKAADDPSHIRDIAHVRQQFQSASAWSHCAPHRWSRIVRTRNAI